MEWKQAEMKVMDLFANSGIGRGYFIRLRHAVLDWSMQVSFGLYLLIMGMIHVSVVPAEPAQMVTS